ncbi:NAD(P)/FAD-dependent oxidoreductase [Streptomyces sp. I05A-00742]|uniref:flavin monoamine oxidase family protein n=1 Tax=Streptomyces sp. I05A-00742 TaxID=2732853 RepID=UPI0028A2B893|nr:NAD(P)/FAD-dependent oxidoreductase [Streptomyces sp. I05A-00742]
MHAFDGIEQKWPRVLVLGAGVAGLTTAYELERRRFRVEVVEGNTRIGGRVLTHRFGPGPDAPAAELGAMRVPAHHRLTLEYIDRMGLTGRLRTFRTLLSEENALLRTPAGFVRVRDASGPLCESFRAELALRGQDCPYAAPTVAFGAWLTAVVDATAPPDLREALRDDLRRQLLELVDRLDPTPHLRGPDRDRIDLHSLFSAHPGIRTGCSGRLNSFLDDILTETSPALLRLEGGMDQLVLRLAARLRGRLSTGRRVVGIDVREDGVLVRVRTGARTIVEHADFVVCTLPFPVLRKLRLHGIDDDKRSVLDDVVYCPATKVALHCREPFWHDEGILGGASFTGGLVRQTYYPAPDDTRGGSGGAALIASYTIGDEAERLGRLPARRRHRFVVEELAAAHPQLRRPGMVLGAASAAWGVSRWSGGCATRWGKSAAACEMERLRAARPAGRLFFAGEHCSTAPAWIEGAIESALNAVHQVVHYVPHRRVLGIPGRRRRTGALR